MIKIIPLYNDRETIEYVVSTREFNAIRILLDALVDRETVGERYEEDTF